MDWIDIPESGLLRTGIKSYPHGKMYSMLIQVPLFVAPSWNRVMRAHTHVRNKMGKLTEAWVAESLMGRYVPELLVAEYMQLTRPGNRNKKFLQTAKTDSPDHCKRWVKSISEVGYRRERITQRPPQFENGVSVNVFHFRSRQIDLDNLCVKFLVDGLVRVGLLEDDSSRFIRALQQIQFPAKQLVSPHLDVVGEEMVMVELTECPRLAGDDEIIMVGDDFP